MRLETTVLFALSVIFAATSCSGQVKPGILSTTNAQVDSLTELGKNIMVIYQDSKNVYWFGSWEDGLYRSDGKSIRHFTTKDGMSHHRINEIREDRSGNLYFNTSGGIDKFDGEKFTRLQVAEAGYNVWKLGPEDLWFICPDYSGCVYRYDGSVLYKLQLPETDTGKEFFASRRSAASPYAVYTIFKDSKGNAWFGTGALGALRYDGKSFDWISETDVTELHNGPSNGVRSIIEDKDGYFWFNSMFRYDVYGKTNQVKNSIQEFYLREKNIGNLDGRVEGDLHEYLSIAKDNNDALWIATYRDGVWKYDGTDIKHYRVQVAGKDITLFSIYKDNHGDLWLGTHENGIFKFNGKSFEKYNL